MHHLNETQLAQLKLQLNSDLIKIRASINTIFLKSDHASHHLAVKNLARLSADELIEFTSKVENNELKDNVEQLKKLDASLVSIEQGMYGLCSDCESELLVASLFENPTRQRCPDCEQKYQKHSYNKYRL
ncbi:molecular chaperone DnaK [Psychromonas sp. psych-6C06]|uniref:TraR/DksA C4-type zinc finger protein n=1 Tax=Psychromonas sp. psych-6C06 TaxID=2058089 RepID=UPI000C337D2A|nr:TraR/DksA C4-type zinc finger protein [Psychromonas sp. psych-6C06]PKF63831.1 molecular chaperone DnaK [Psychromonas sp. psych-6C06]